MSIRCPHCGSRVASDPATDRPPEHCPRCRGALRRPARPVSVASLLKTPPQAVAPGSPPIETPPASPLVSAASATAAIQVPADEAAPTAHPPAPTEQATAVPASRPAPVPTSPSFAGRALDARPRRRRRILGGSVVALTLLLGLQVLLADRARLSSDPGWRPVLARLCGVLRCSLPPWREPAALTVLARDVRPDRARPDQLLAAATFRNDARWAQAWPRLRLTLSDSDGRTVAARVFTAQEYLDSAPEQPTLAAGDSAQARLRLVDPDPRAVSFTFEFL